MDGGTVVIVGVNDMSVRFIADSTGQDKQTMDHSITTCEAVKTEPEITNARLGSTTLTVDPLLGVIVTKVCKLEGAAVGFKDGGEGTVGWDVVGLLVGLAMGLLVG